MDEQLRTSPDPDPERPPDRSAGGAPNAPPEPPQAVLEALRETIRDLSRARVFCDWLTVTAELPADTPAFNDGQLLYISHDGEIERGIDRYKQVAGSYGTGIRLRISGGRLYLSGNIGRYCRPDNVSGATLEDCLTMALRFVYDQTKVHVDPACCEYSRVDLTANTRAGSPERVRALLNAAATRGIQKMRRDHFGTTVAWRNRRRRFKLYDKAEELTTHHKGAEQDPLLQSVLRCGLLRAELELRRDWLKDHGLHKPQRWTRALERTLFHEQIEDLGMNKAIAPSKTWLEDVPGYLGTILHAWHGGHDIWAKLLSDHPQRTAYRYRSKIRTLTGIDIALRNPNVIPFEQSEDKQQEKIKLAPWYPPAWYRFESPLLNAEDNERVNAEIHGVEPPLSPQLPLPIDPEIDPENKP